MFLNVLLLFYQLASIIAILPFDQFLKSGQNWSDFYSVNNTGYDSLNKNQVIQLVFNTEAELFASNAWKDLQKKKNPFISGRAFIIIKEVNALYFFRDSEFKTESDSTSLLRIQNWFKSSREIKLWQLSIGEGRKLDFTDIPITPCILAKMSGAGASFDLTKQYDFTFSYKMSPMLKIAVPIVGISASTEIGSIDITFSYFRTLTCAAPSGSRLQIVSSFLYIYFPNAYKRNIVYKGNRFEVDHEEDAEGDGVVNEDGWARVYNGDPRYSKYGLVFYDQTAPLHTCFGTEEKLQCESGFYDIKNLDPIEGLHWAEKFPHKTHTSQISLPQPHFRGRSM